MMDSDRRRLLRRAAAVALADGLCGPALARAAWNQRAFDTRRLSDALAALGIANRARSADIVLEAPTYTDDSGNLPLEVTSRIAGTETISILIDKNPFPYIARFDVSQGAAPYVTLRVRIAETSLVRAVVSAGGRQFETAREVGVTVGGCAATGSAGDLQGGGAAQPMKARARLAGGVADVRVLMSHPHENGLRKDAAGKLIPEHFIRNFTVQRDGRTVFAAELGRSVSTNPLLGFRLRGAKANDTLTLRWEDSRGQTRTDTVAVVAG